VCVLRHSPMAEAKHRKPLNFRGQLVIGLRQIIQGCIGIWPCREKIDNMALQVKTGSFIIYIYISIYESLRNRCVRFCSKTVPIT